jgi:hypothetical protein
MAPACRAFVALRDDLDFLPGIENRPMRCDASLPSTSDRVVIKYQRDLRKCRPATSMNEITVRPSIFITEKNRATNKAFI